MKLSYLQQGFGTRSPLVLLHPFPLDSRFWSNQLAGLSKDRHVIAPSFRGYGHSQTTDSNADFTVERFATDIRKTLKTVQIPKAIFAGCSMGGYVLFELWRQAPDLIDGMILADTKAEPDTEEARTKRYEQIEKINNEGTAYLPDTVAGFMAESVRRDHPEIEQEVRSWAADAPDSTVVKSLQMLASRPDSRPTLSTIDVPTLIFVGQEDRITPQENAVTMQDGIQNSQLVVVPDSGHLSPLENPRFVNSEISGFLTEFESATA